MLGVTGAASLGAERERGPGWNYAPCVCSEPTARGGWWDRKQREATSEVGWVPRVGAHRVPVPSKEMQGRLTQPGVRKGPTLLHSRISWEG